MQLTYWIWKHFAYYRHKHYLHLRIILCISLFIPPDKPAGIVIVLFIVAIIYSNKNIMHREEKVERIVVFI